MLPALPSRLASLSLCALHPSWLRTRDGITLEYKSLDFSVGPDAQCVQLLFLESYSVKLELAV